MTVQADQPRRPAEAAPEDAVRVAAAPGSELVVRPETRLRRVATSPAVARVIGVGRSAAEASAPLARGALTALATATVTWPAPRAGRVLGKFVSGAPLAGPVRTDATFWRNAHKDHLPGVPGETAGWSSLAGWQRAVVRLSGCAVSWAGAYTALPAETLTVTYSAGATGVLWGAWGAHRWTRTRGHRKRYLWPLHEALRNAVQSPARDPQEWIHVPHDFKSRPGVEIRIDLPSTFDGSDGSQNHVRTVVRNKLGLDAESTAAFHLAGDRPFVLFREPSRPPKRVGLSDIAELISKAADTAPIVGLAAGNRQVNVDLEAESPHVLVSGGSGAGKSILLRVILAQGLAKGGYGIVLDIKKVSHMWASNLPNCEYYRTAEAIHDRLLSLQAEVDRRNNIVVQYADIDGNTDHIDVGPRIYVLAEEMNATIGRLNAYWRAIKEKGQQNTSPAVEALQDLLFMGRQIKIHVVAVAQMASARSMGGGEARENYATRCLARYTQNAWKMLVPEVWPMPKKSKQPGRWQIVNAGVATETQVVYLTAREARELALAGYSSAPRTAAAPAPVHAANLPAPVSWTPYRPGDLQQQHAEPVPGPDPGADHEAGEEEPEEIPAQVVVGLREAIERGIVDGWTLPNLRKARQRSHDFPQPVGQSGQEMLYDAEELGKWSRNRRRGESDEI